MRPHLRIAVDPVAAPASVIVGATYRITVLDAGLVRLEYSQSGQFEDRASQTVVNRAFGPGDPFTVTETRDRLTLRTRRLRLVYDKQPFSTDGLSVQATAARHSPSSVWRYGVPTSNLGGTARALDDVDGACPLEPGILSRDGITVLDDSRTVLLTDDGWVDARRPGNQDLYVFAYGRDYRRALRALYRLTGPQPLLPRFALGNWWSRYYPYTAVEYLRLLDRFAAERIPLSVAVIDMEWHLVEIDPRFGTGWTGYTWNAELFPDPPGFLADLHERGLATSLNVHPAEGVHAHEQPYPAIAARLGVDPASELPIDFDSTDPRFLEAYLDELHHPLEAQGVDFWWVDLQQGDTARIAGPDPLWLLNHFHYLDAARAGRRPLILSRYAGVGSHRYPIGFSGDTLITWAALDFQPFFTATASNVGYGWWSHDVGGHHHGRKDDELAVRWLQLGVFSPITRLHSNRSVFNTKEPWRFGEHAAHVMKRFLRLRHQLLPYLYTMNRRAHADGEPLVQPMYYDHPDDEAAYAVPNQYMFGDRLMVAPITTPVDPATLLGAVKAWLPDGGWIDIFTGLTYRGGTTGYLHRDLDSIPVLARAGAIVPLTPLDRVMCGTANPDALELRVYAGADGGFTLAEDRMDEQWAETSFTYDSGAGDLRIHPVVGRLASVPATRTYDVVLCGFAAVTGVDVTIDGRPVTTTPAPGPVPGSTTVRLPEVPATAQVALHLAGDHRLAPNQDVADRLFTLIDRAQISFDLKDAIDTVIGHGDVRHVISGLTALDLDPPLRNAIVELLLANPPLDRSTG
jgi:alpha-glucosidase (family GH31 glycosyl hydrolase)